MGGGDEKDGCDAGSGGGDPGSGGGDAGSGGGVNGFWFWPVESGVCINSRVAVVFIGFHATVGDKYSRVVNVYQSKVVYMR